MQPFRVICETCNARLKISSESVIGEIHACPKCGSMVEIRRPTDSQVAIAQQTNSETIELVPPSAPTFETAESLDAITPAVAANESPVEPATPPSPAATGWSMTTWSGIAAAALLVTGGMVAVVMLNGDDVAPTTPPPVAQANTAADQREVTPTAQADLTKEPVAPIAAGHAADSTGDDNPPPTAEVNEAATEPEAQAAVPTVPALPPVEEQTPAASDPPAENSPAENVAQSVDVAKVATAEPVAAAAPKRNSPVMKFDPLDFDPAQFNFNESQPASEQRAETTVPNNGDAEPPAANGDANATSEPAPKPEPPPPASTLTMRLGPMPDADKDKTPKPAVAQLAVRLGSFSVSEMPLTRFVAMVSELGDVPITLDPIQLQLAGVSPRQLVAADINETSAEKILAAVLKKSRLSIVERDGNLSVGLMDADRRREVVYDVADLCGDSADTKSIVSLIRSLVAPESWEGANSGTIAAEGTKLRINQSQAVRHQVLIFAERLRAARGLPQRSKYPAALLRVRSPYDAVKESFAQRATFTFLPWSEFADVVDQWQQATKLTLLVDWSVLSRAGLGPSSPVMSSAVDRPWRDVFDESLDEIGLGWWAVDGETVQITMNDAVNELRVVEFHIVPDAVRDQFASTAALVEAMQQELSKLGAKEPASPAVATYDEPSGRLLVLANAAAHRYLTERFSPDARVAAHE